MPNVLLIDDEPELRSLLSTILVKNDFAVTFAEDGASGLRQAKELHPDLIILDIIMPGMDGFEVIRRLQEDPSCSHIPIMVLTAIATSYGRQTATDAGANDFVTKPFTVGDLVTRAKTMTDKADILSNRSTKPLKTTRQSRLFSVHSLRGGLGCTALAVNLAFALNNMLHRPTLLLDGDFARGQVAMALRLSTALSWSDLLRSSASNSVHRALEDKSIAHESGLHILTAPRNPDHADRFSTRFVSNTLGLFEHRYEYVIADLAHDFRGNTIELLKNSEMILYLLSPDSVSLQLTIKAMDTMTSMGIKPENVELILVDTRPNKPINLTEIEQRIGHSLSAYIPYAAEMSNAIDRGMPFINAYPSHEISGLTEDLAYLLSNSVNKEPTQARPVSSYAKPRNPLSPADQNGTQHGVGRSLLKRMGLVK